MLLHAAETNRFFDALPLFHDLTPAQLERAREVLSLLRVGAGHVVIAADTPGDMIYIVANGSVKICALGGETEVILGVHGPGEVLGEMSVLDGEKRSATVTAQEPTVLLRLSQCDFWNVLWEMPAFSRNMMCLLTRRVRVLTLQVQALSALDVRGRLARQLVVWAEEYGQPYPAKGENARLIPFQLKQIELAAMIGSTREQVNGLLSAWLRRGFIARDRVRNGHLVVCQAEALRQFFE